MSGQMMDDKREARSEKREAGSARRITGVSPVLMQVEDCVRGGFEKVRRGLHGQDARDTGTFLAFLLCVLCVLCGGSLHAAEPEVSERDLPRIPAVEPKDAVKTLKV